MSVQDEVVWLRFIMQIHREQVLLGGPAGSVR